MEFPIKIYIGAPVEVASEAKALRQLMEDLEGVGKAAILLLNFEVGERQIDCVVVTEDQATLLEVKNLNGPVKGGVNGPWILRSDGGVERPYEGENPYQQVLTAKFRLSDAMKAFHATTGVGCSPQRAQFFRLFEAAVCVWPDLDVRSTVEGDFKCHVWGYPKALHEITSRRLPSHWSIDDWTRFSLEHLNLEQVSLSAAISPDFRSAERTLHHTGLP